MCHYNRISCLPRLFAARGKFFYSARKICREVTAPICRDFAARGKIEISYPRILPDLYRKSLPRFCRDFAAMQQGRGTIFFS
jgi:hypothetical protein